MIDKPNLYVVVDEERKKGFDMIPPSWLTACGRSRPRLSRIAMVTMAQSAANRRSMYTPVHGSHAFTDTLTSTQLQPRCANRQLMLLHNLESNVILKVSEGGGVTRSTRRKPVATLGMGYYTHFTQYVYIYIYLFICSFLNLPPVELFQKLRGKFLMKSNQGQILSKLKKNPISLTCFYSPICEVPDLSRLYYGACPLTHNTTLSKTGISPKRGCPLH